MRRGTTLAELMVSVGFLGLGAVALLTCVNASLAKEGYSRRRAIILAAAENTIDAVRSNASMGTILTGSTPTTLVVPGLESTVTVTTTITLQTSYSDLYLVDVVASWSEHPAVGITRADSIVLDTFIRTNDT